MPLVPHLSLGLRCDLSGSFQEPLEEEEEEKDPNSPLMVPGADILNHLANHNANLEYSAVSGPHLVLLIALISSDFKRVITGLHFPTHPKNEVKLAPPVLLVFTLQ